MARAAFLFGSGISRASNGPSVDQITDMVIKESVHPSVACAQAFLKLVKSEIDPHLQKMEGRDANYEDLYAASYQIFQDQASDITSPLIWRSLNILREGSTDLQGEARSHGHTDPFLNLVAEANDLIQGFVWQSLRPVVEPAGLSAVTEMATNTESLDIFTLNHDLLIEKLLDQNGIPFSDGFDEKDKDLTRFSWSWKPTDKVRLFKLHGSINWFRFDFFKPDRQIRQYSKGEGDHRYWKPETGYVHEVDSLPAVLTGTTVKEQTYGIYLFGEIFSKFRCYLSKHDTLIASGYGWGDKGINHRLNQWLGDGQDHRLIILHAGSKEEIIEKRFWQTRWGDYEQLGKVKLVNKWLSDCTLADLTPYFDQRPAPAPQCG